MSIPYKHVLIIGATSGIGKAMADQFISHDVKVTAVGRRQERLDDLVSQHGSAKVSVIPFDIVKLDEIPVFVETAFKNHPTIDSVFLNAGTQSYVDFAKPDTVDLDAFQRECTVNFNAQVALVHAVLPHLLKCSSATSLIFTGTQVSLIPTFPMPAYSASKAALESFIICLREQLRETNVRVQHVSPGPVQTEIHANYGMLLEDFVNEAWVGLIKGSEDIYPGCVGGTTKEQFLELVKIRDEAAGRMSGLLREMMKKQWS